MPKNGVISAAKNWKVIFHSLWKKYDPAQWSMNIAINLTLSSVRTSVQLLVPYYSQLQVYRFINCLKYVWSREFSDLFMNILLYHLTVTWLSWNIEIWNHCCSCSDISLVFGVSRVYFYKEFILKIIIGEVKYLLHTVIKIPKYKFKEEHIYHWKICGRGTSADVDAPQVQLLDSYISAASWGSSD